MWKVLYLYQKVHTAALCRSTTTQTPRQEIEANSQGSLWSWPENEGVSLPSLPIHREVKCSLPGYPGGPPLSLGSAGESAGGPVTGRPRLHSYLDLDPGSLGGADLVANSPHPVEREDNPMEISAGNNSVRCLPGRLGSGLQWGENRRFTDSTGTEATHQLPGASCLKSWHWNHFSKTTEVWQPFYNWTTEQL